MSKWKRILNSKKVFLKKKVDPVSKEEQFIYGPRTPKGKKLKHPVHHHFGTGWFRVTHEKSRDAFPRVCLDPEKLMGYIAPLIKSGKYAIDINSFTSICPLVKEINQDSGKADTDEAIKSFVEKNEWVTAKEFLEKVYILGLARNGEEYGLVINSDNRLHYLSFSELIPLIPEIKSFMEKTPDIISRLKMEKL